jgi:poly(ADP-ribose) polymerase-like protein
MNIGTMPHSQSRKWHSDISSYMWANKQEMSSKYTAVSVTPFGKKDIFILQSYTNDYVRKKGHIEAHQLEKRIRALVDQCKYWIHGFLACSHRLSREAIREYLVEILQYVKTDEHIRNYLSVVIFVARFDGAPVSADERERAQAIIELLDFKGEYTSHLVYLYTLLRRGVNETLFEDKEMKMQGLPETIWSDAISYLATLRNNPTLWLHAQGYLSWLRSLLNISERDVDLSIVDTNFPGWRAWALWTPNKQKLSWIARLPSDCVNGLSDFLALEGPDFLKSKNNRLLDSIIEDSVNKRIVYGNLNIHIATLKGTPSEAIEEAFELLEKAVSLSREAVQLFSSTIVNGVKEFENSFEILKVALAESATNEEQITALNRLYSAKNLDDRFEATLRLLPILQDPVCTEVSKYMSMIINRRAFRSLNLLKLDFAKDKEAPLLPVGDLSIIKGISKVYPWLEASLRQTERWRFVERLPTIDIIRTLFQINRWLGTLKDQQQGQILKVYLKSYFEANVCGKGIVHEDTTTRISSFCEFWMKENRVGRRNFAIRSTEWAFLPPVEQKDLLKSISGLTDLDCETLLAVTTNSLEMSCVNFAKLIASASGAILKALKSWRRVLYVMIERNKKTLLGWTASHLDLFDWLRWLRNIRLIFFGTDNSRRSPSALFDPALHEWAKCIDMLPRLQLERLSKLLIPGPGLSNILLYDLARCERLELLRDLATRGLIELRKLYDFLFTQIPLVKKNIILFRMVIDRLATASKDELAVCRRFTELAATASPMALSGIITSYTATLGFGRLGYCKLNQHNVDLLRNLLPYLVGSGSPNLVSLSQATDYLDNEFEKILQHVAEIQALRTALRLHDVDQTANLLEALGIEDNDPMIEIPDDLVDVIEPISYFEYEICFPLDHLKPLQRLALCIGDARNLLVRINLEHGLDNPVYCVHLDPGPNDKSTSKTKQSNQFKHVYWDPKAKIVAPDYHYCHSKPNIVTSQIFRTMTRNTKSGLDSLGNIHKVVSHALQNLASLCYACGVHHGVRLFRPTLCQSFGCALVKVDSKLSYVDFRPEIYDLLLSSIYHASCPLKIELLVGSPFFAEDVILDTFRKLPALDSLAKKSDRSRAITALGTNPAKLLRWISSFPGFIAEASGTLRIPSMPNIRQFVVSSPVNIEGKKSIHFCTQPQTQVVFHGTTMARVWPILMQGLRVGSGTSLQRIGAAHGNGIYCAIEPSIALGYTTPEAPNWGYSQFAGMKVLLGCELYGTHSLTSSSHQFYVIRNPNDITVRYVFLVPANTQIPISRHVAPAMQSAFSLLRSGLA